MGKTPLFAVFLLLAACADDTVTIDVIERAGDDLAAADDLLSTHARAVAGATSIEEVRGLERTLLLEWEDLEADLLADLDAIEDCDATGVGLDRIDRIRDALDDLRLQVREHVSANRQAEALEEALEEEVLLQDRALQLLSDIDGERELLQEDIRCLADLGGEGGLAQER